MLYYFLVIGTTFSLPTFSLPTTSAFIDIKLSRPLGIPFQIKRIKEPQAFINIPAEPRFKMMMDEMLGESNLQNKPSFNTHLFSVIPQKATVNPDSISENFQKEIEELKRINIIEDGIREEEPFEKMQNRIVEVSRELVSLNSFKDAPKYTEEMQKKFEEIQLMLKSLILNYEHIVRKHIETAQDIVQKHIEGSKGIVQKHIEGAQGIVQKHIEGAQEIVNHLQKLITSAITDVADLHGILFPQLLPPPPLSWFQKLMRPFHQIGNFLASQMINHSADDTLRNELKFIPAMFKKDCKKCLVEVSSSIYDTICRGKRHPNPNIQKLAFHAQVLMVKRSRNIPFSVGMKTVDFICQLQYLKIK